tara:strand:+ start:444 stop:680 length:237 start_codon:yes stop_codon:yes gene_type:complete
MKILPSKYYLPRGYNKPIIRIQHVSDTDLIIINGSTILAPYGFYGSISSSELYKGSFSSRTRELTNKELRAITKIVKQ